MPGFTPKPGPQIPIISPFILFTQHRRHRKRKDLGLHGSPPACLRGTLNMDLRCCCLGQSNHEPGRSPHCCPGASKSSPFSWAGDGPQNKTPERLKLKTTLALEFPSSVNFPSYWSITPKKVLPEMAKFYSSLVSAHSNYKELASLVSNAGFASR